MDIGGKEQSEARKVVWPDNKTFAFTIFDDTDRATIRNIGPVYRFLADHGFRTTKSVWPSSGKRKSNLSGDTCDDPAYAKWLLELQRLGFEIGYHLNTFHDSTREEILAGLRKFTELFGHTPRTMSQHAGCADSLYWGPHRLTGFYRTIYNVATRCRNVTRYRGHIKGDPYFWGDLCQKEVTYCRNFTFPDINTFKACPYMPYHDPARPYVNYWFASSAGPDADLFTRCLSEANQDRLEREGGACIMYTHLASGFVEHGGLAAEFTRLMERLSRKNGCFIPVHELLDYLMRISGPHVITSRERRELERKWLWHKLRIGTY